MPKLSDVLAGASEDDVQFGANPIDDLRRTVNARKYTPEQAAQNRQQSLSALLSVVPGPGNVISAKDAWDASGEGAKALSEGRYGEAAGNYGNMALATLGAVMGHPWSREAQMAGQDGSRTLNIFAGPKAKTADHEALAKAMEMSRSGVSRDDTWRDTGWFQGKDGKWRFEIDDSKARLSSRDVTADGGTTFKEYQNPDLYRAYGAANLPDIDGKISQNIPTEGGAFGQNSIMVRAKDEERARSIAAHEMQHGVQEIEGFAPGGNWREAMQTPQAQAAIRQRAEEMKAAGVDLSDEDIISNAQAEVARDMYRRIAGEVEARNVQTRLDFSPEERRAQTPWSTQDVPDDQQIVRFR